MDEFEKRIKKEFDNMKLTDVDMTALVRKQIESIEANQNLKRNYKKNNNKKVVYLRKIRRVAAAALALIMLFGISTGVYAGFNDMSLIEACNNIWNHITGMSTIDQVSCDAKIESENSTFEDVEVKPYKIIGDEYGIYIVLRITSQNEIVLQDTMAFENYDIRYENDADAALDMYYLGCENNALYVAVEYTGGISDCGIADAGKIKLRLDNIYTYDYLEDGKKPRLNNEDESVETDCKRIVSSGTYKATISYSYNSSVKAFKADDQMFEVSNLTIRCKTNDEDNYYNMLEQMPCVNLNDGKKIYAQSEFGIDDESSYVVIYRLDSPVIPEDIIGVTIE